MSNTSEACDCKDKLAILYNDILCEILQQPGISPRVEELCMQGVELIREA